MVLKTIFLWKEILKDMKYSDLPRCAELGEVPWFGILEKFSKQQPWRCNSFNERQRQLGKSNSTDGVLQEIANLMTWFFKPREKKRI